MLYFYRSVDFLLCFMIESAKITITGDNKQIKHFQDLSKKLNYSNYKLKTSI